MTKIKKLIQEWICFVPAAESRVALRCHLGVVVDIVVMSWTVDSPPPPVHCPCLGDCPARAYTNTNVIEFPTKLATD